MMMIPSLLVLVLVAVASIQCASVPANEADNRSEDAFPGRNLSPAAQCQIRLPAGDAQLCKTKDPASRCSELICVEPNRGDIPFGIETGPALDGTWCGDKRICFKGSCIDDTQPAEKSLEITDIEYDCDMF